MFLPENHLPIKVFLSSSMDETKPEHLEARRTLKVLFDRQRFFRLTLIEETVSPSGPGPRMRTLVYDADIVVIVLHNEPHIVNGLLIREGIQTEIEAVRRVGVPVLAFLEESLSSSETHGIKATIDYIRGLGVFTGSFHNIEDLAKKIDTGLFNTLRDLILKEKHNSIDARLTPESVTAASEVRG
jgi:hypothetical protein